MDEKNEQGQLEESAGALTAAEDEALPEDTAPEAPEEEEEARPDTVFGLKRRTFHLVVVGYALGIIVISFCMMGGLYPEESGTVIPGVVGGGLGWLLSRYLDKRDEEKDGEP